MRGPPVPTCCSCAHDGVPGPSTYRNTHAGSPLCTVRRFMSPCFVHVSVTRRFPIPCRVPTHPAPRGGFGGLHPQRSHVLGGVLDDILYRGSVPPRLASEPPRPARPAISEPRPPYEPAPTPQPPPARPWRDASNGELAPDPALLHQRPFRITAGPIMSWRRASGASLLYDIASLDTRHDGEPSASCRERVTSRTSGYRILCGVGRRVRGRARHRVTVRSASRRTS